MTFFLDFIVASFLQVELNTVSQFTCHNLLVFEQGISIRNLMEECLFLTDG